jgi:hypothetical protein
MSIHWMVPYHLVFKVHLGPHVGFGGLMTNI